MSYDPTIYEGAAAHYLVGRPPYSPSLLSVLGDELGLDGTGLLLDVGCGPGVLAVQLAPGFAHVTALDPDAEMLAEGERLARALGRMNISWIHDVAENIVHLDLGPVRVASFGQSFHWMERDVVAESIYDALEPGGAMVLIWHDHDRAIVPTDLAYPEIPDDAVHELIRHYLGAATRRGQGTGPLADERHEQVLARTRFGSGREVSMPGAVVTKDVEQVISMYLSMSSAAPHLFGNRLASFVSALRRLLTDASPSGRFSEFPGDTVALIATRGR